MNVKQGFGSTKIWFREVKLLTEMERDGYLQHKVQEVGMSIYLAEKLLAPFSWDFVATAFHHHFGYPFRNISDGLRIRYCEQFSHRFTERVYGEHSILTCSRCGYESENIWFSN